MSKEVIVNKFSEIADLVDQVLNEYDQQNNLQIPVLVAMVAAKMNMSPDMAKQIDPAVRWYIKEHPSWEVSRGAKGGVIPASKMKARIDAKSNKVKLKKELTNKIEEMTADSDQSVKNTDSE